MLLCSSRKSYGDEKSVNDSWEANTASPLKQICRKHSGFVSLQNFFGVKLAEQQAALQNARLQNEERSSEKYKTETAAVKVATD